MGNTADHPPGLLLALLSIFVITVSTIFYFYEKNENNVHYKNSEKLTRIFSFRTWRQVHLAAQFCFLGVVLGGTTTEIICFKMGRYQDFFPIIPYLDHFVALPSLAIACFSGVSMVNIKYFSRKAAVPKNIDKAMWVLQGFGAYWVVADKVTQAMEASPIVIWARTFINLGSCTLSIYMWSLMKQPPLPKSSTD